MAKDKLGHGSEAHAAHKAAHGPSGVEHGTWGKGSHFHNVDASTMKEAEKRFGAEKLKKVDAYAHRQKAISAARSGTSGAPPIEKGRPR